MHKIFSFYLGYLTYHQKDKTQDLLFKFDSTTFELLQIYSGNHNGKVFISHSNNTFTDNIGNKMEVVYGGKGFITETRIYKGSLLQHSVRYENLINRISKTSFFDS